MIEYIANLFMPIAHAATEAAAEHAETSGSIAGMFGIDWKLFIAQLVNFLIIYFVLAKFVFKPLSKKLEERSAKVEQSLKNAEETEAKLQMAEEHRQAEIKKAREEAAAVIAEAQKSAEQAKEQILTEGRANSERMVEQAKKEISAAKEKLITEIREEAADLVVIAAEKILREKLDPKKDAELIKNSLKSMNK